jgi:hypothetical protein
MTEWWERGGEHVDKLMAAVGWMLVLANWMIDRHIKDRLADVEVPHGAQLTILIFALIGRRARNRQWTEASESMNELAEALANRMVATDARQQQLVDLQSSLERLAHESSSREETLVALQQSVTRYTRWLLVLTVAVALIGAGTIVVAATH